MFVCGCGGVLERLDGSISFSPKSRLRSTQYILSQKRCGEMIEICWFSFESFAFRQSTFHLFEVFKIYSIDPAHKIVLEAWRKPQRRTFFPLCRPPLPPPPPFYNACACITDGKTSIKIELDSGHLYTILNMIQKHYYFRLLRPCVGAIVIPSPMQPWIK